MESQYIAIFGSLGRSVPSLMFESGFFAKAILNKLSKCINFCFGISIFAYSGMSKNAASKI